MDKQVRGSLPNINHFMPLFASPASRCLKIQVLIDFMGAEVLVVGSNKIT